MGEKLFQNLIQNSGLPENIISKELLSLCQKRGLSISSLTLDDVRLILADYLQDVLLKAKEEFTE